MRYVSRTWGLLPAMYMVMGVGVAAATEGLGHAATEELGHAAVASGVEPSVTVQTTAATATAGGAAGAIIHVDAGATGGNDGSSWCDAYRSPQDALIAAVPGDTILVAQGTYMPDSGYTPVGGTLVPGDLERTATFRLVTGVTLQGGYAGCGQPNPNERDVNAFETILSGDLSGNDTPAACTRDLDCRSFGVLVRCSNGICVMPNNPNENSYHVVTGSGTDSSAVLDGFTISAGNANGSFPNAEGGGMFNNGGNPMVTNCTFSGNSATWGGGMYNSASGPTVTNCAFSGNSAGAGGGMFNTSSDPTMTHCSFGGNSAAVGGGMYNVSSSPTATNCTFNGNSADDQGGNGGGMYNSSGRPTVTDCTFSGNFARDAGGGMFNISGDPTVTDCTFGGNRAFVGGGMSNSSNSPTVANCTFNDNSANALGGGMYNISSSPTVTNCTFGGNSADGNFGFGGGMYNDFSGPAVNNCILWGNNDFGGMDESAQIHTDSGTPTVNYSIVQGGWIGAGGVGVVDADPLFVDADGPDDVAGTEDDDLRLMPGSPAIDAGSNAAVPPDMGDLDGDGDTGEPTPLDLDGNPRFVDVPGSPDCPHGGDCGAAPIVDMGAFEFICEFSGDADGDADVDLDDFLDFLDCAADAPAPACTDFDADCDGNVNLFDFGGFQRAFTGP